jgi:diacylglycerol kinase (ATP)
MSQRIVVEKTVINQYEQVQNQTKKSEISIENSKRVVLSDNNSSSTSTVVEKSREKLTESNGMVQNCERFSGKECTMENNVNDTEQSAKAPKASSSCSDLLIFCQSQAKPKPEIPEQAASVADFAIPYNIINNYFSGLYKFCLHE